MVRLHSPTIRLVALVFVTAAGSAVAQANGDLRTVLMTGDHAAGLDESAAYLSPFEMDFNNAGQVAVKAFIYGPGFSGGSDYGIWDDSSGRLELIARIGDQAPSLPEGIVFRDLDGFHLDDLGRTTFHAGVNRPLLPYPAECLGCGIWRERGDGLEPFSTYRDSLLGLPDNVSLHSAGIQSVTPTGKLLVKAFFTGPGFDGQGANWILRELPEGVFSSVVRLFDDQAPGYEEGASILRTNYDGYSSTPLVINKKGQTAFHADVINPDLSSLLPSAIFSDRSGELALIARVGDQAPGVEGDAKFSDYYASSIQLSNSGEVAFVAYVQSSDVKPDTESHGIWSDVGSDDLRLIVRSGDPAPGVPSGYQFDLIHNYVMGERGELYFNARAIEDKIDSAASISGLWIVDNGGDLAPAILEGDHPPGVNGDITITSVGGPSLNSTGQYMVRLTLDDPSSDRGIDWGLWATSPDGILTHIIRVGDTIDVNDDSLVQDLRTVSYLTESFLNDRGEVAFMAYFTDSTSGIFVSRAVAIPEPGVAWLVGISIAAQIVLCRPTR